MNNITVIGTGRWGSFIAWYLDRIGHHVTLYGRSTSANMQEFLQTRKNDYLTLPESIQLTTSYETCKEADIIVISVGSQVLYQVAEQLKVIMMRLSTTRCIQKLLVPVIRI